MRIFRACGHHRHQPSPGRGAEGAPRGGGAGATEGRPSPPRSHPLPAAVERGAGQCRAEGLFRRAARARPGPGEGLLPPDVRHPGPDGRTDHAAPHLTRPAAPDGDLRSVRRAPATQGGAAFPCAGFADPGEFGPVGTENPNPTLEINEGSTTSDVDESFTCRPSSRILQEALLVRFFAQFVFQSLRTARVEPSAERRSLRWLAECRNTKGTLCAGLRPDRTTELLFYFLEAFHHLLCIPHALVGYAVIIRELAH